MKVSLISGRELSDDVARAWLLIQQGNPELASPFFHPEFTKIVASARNDVEVAIIESEGKIAGLFPFHRGVGGIGRSVGEIISDYQGVISAQDFRFSPRELLRYSRLIIFDFDHLPTSQLNFAPFQSSIELSPQIDLSKGYEAYAQERRRAGSEVIKKIGNVTRRLERELGPLRFVADSGDRAALATVLGWKSDQYRKTANRNLFAPGWIREAVDRIFATRSDGYSGTLSLLYAGDELIAGHFGMRSRAVWHYWFPTYDPKVATHSPGLILLLKMAEHAASIEVSIIDLGKGESPYKKRFMNNSSLLASGSVELPSWRTLSRRTFRALRSQIAASPAVLPARAALNWFRGVCKV